MSCLTSLDSSRPIQKTIFVNHEHLCTQFLQTTSSYAHLLLHSRNNSSRNKDAYAKGSTLLLLKKGRQRNAERELYTPYQSEDPSPTIPTYRQKEETGKNSRRL